MLALPTPLDDPSALPNRHNPFEGLHPETRILFANDRVEPDVNLVQLHILDATLVVGDEPDSGGLLLSAPKEARDVVVAYIHGPVAAVEEVSWARGNLAPRNDTAFGADPATKPLEQVRQYVPGRVPVHLLSRIDLRDQAGAAGTGSVRVASVGNIFLPRWAAIEATTALGAHEGLETGTGRPRDRAVPPESPGRVLRMGCLRADRHDPEPVDPPPSVDPRNNPEPSPRDFRHEEASATLERAVRDRFTRLTAEPLTASVENSDLANWLPGSTFATPEGSPLRPKISLESGPAGPVEAPLPAMAFRWDGAMPDDNLPDQTLSLVDSPALGDEAAPVRWLDARLRWTDGEAVERKIQVHPDGRAAARAAKASDIPLLEHRQVISAVAAGWLSGRYWEFFAVESPAPNRLYAREPLAESRPPIDLDSLLTLDPAQITLLTLDAGKNTLRLAVVQEDHCTIALFNSEDGEIGPSALQSNIKKVPPLPAPIADARIAARRLFLGLAGEPDTNTLRVYSLSTPGNNAPEEFFAAKAGRVRHSTSAVSLVNRR